MRFKSAEQLKIEMLENQIKHQKNKSISKKIEDLAWEMNNKYSRGTVEDDAEFDKQTIEQNFKRFLSIVFDEQHDNRICGLELTDNNKNTPALLLTVDADVHIGNATDIMFAVGVFIEEWYSELQYGDILTEWV